LPSGPVFAQTPQSVEATSKRPPHIGLATAVASPCAVPGVLPPVEFEGGHFIDVPPLAEQARGGLKVRTSPAGRASTRSVPTYSIIQLGRARSRSASTTVARAADAIQEQLRPA
jgi:hypothetical protein